MNSRILLSTSDFSLTKKELDRFLSYIDKSKDCWNWIGGKSPKGYGKIWVRNITLRSNRLAYYLFKGPIPVDMDVLHSCDNPPCCNPKHLWLGSNQDNMKDRDNKGRQYKISQETIDKIMQLYNNKMPQVKIAAELGMPITTINNIVQKNR